MPTHRTEDRLDLECMCHHPEHFIRLMYDADDLMVTYHLSNVSFLWRLWNAIKYVFGYKSKWGCFDEMMLDCEDAKEIIKYLNFYLGENDYTVIHYVYQGNEMIGECEND